MTAARSTVFLASLVALLAGCERTGEPARQPAPSGMAEAPAAPSPPPAPAPADPRPRSADPEVTPPAPVPEAPAAVPPSAPAKPAARPHRAPTAGILGSAALQQGSAFASLGGTGVASRASAVPSVRLGPAAVEGPLDKASVRRTIRRHLAKFTYCYEKHLLSNPTLEGTVTARFSLGPDGRVVVADVGGVDPSVSACIQGVLAGIEFARPTTDEPVHVFYPFTLRPNGG